MIAQSPNWNRKFPVLQSIMTKKPPVVLFNASTRITGMSQNAAFSLLTAWALKIRGQPVIHYICGHGMSSLRIGDESRGCLAGSPLCPLYDAITAIIQFQRSDVVFV